MKDFLGRVAGGERLAELARRVSEQNIECKSFNCKCIQMKEGIEEQSFRFCMDLGEG